MCTASKLTLRGNVKMVTSHSLTAVTLIESRFKKKKLVDNYNANEARLGVISVYFSVLTVLGLTTSHLC